MAIKPSAAAEIRSLLDTLTESDQIRREGAIARLAVIGSRATDRLLAAYAIGSTREDVRVAILRVFEGSADPRALPVLREALEGPATVGIAAVPALRALLSAPAPGPATDALDALVAVVLNAERPRTLRLAAFEALRDTPGDIEERLARALASDPDPIVRARVEEGAEGRRALQLQWTEALNSGGGADATGLLETAQHHAQVAPLGEVQRMIDAIRRREVESPGTAPQWREARGYLHAVLARRGSTVALYDLRETLEGTNDRLPAGFVEALRLIGDESCLEATAAAWTRVEDEDWRAQLAASYGAIVTRERISLSHPVVKRLATRWPAAAAAFSTPSRTTPRRTRRVRT